jgi:hypothetical protein
MYLLALDIESAPESGTGLFNTEGKQLGTIINAQPNEQGKIEALAVLSTSNTEINQVVMNQTKISVELLDLPYDLG